MATATYIPAKLVRSQVLNAGPQLKFDTQSTKCAVVVAGSGRPDTSKTGVQYVADVTSGNAEVTGTGYARQTLASITVAFGSGDDVDYGFANITFSQNAGGFSNGRYGVLFYDTGGADLTNPVIAILDFGQTVSVVGGDLVLSAPAGGLIQWTKSP